MCGQAPPRRRPCQAVSSPWFSCIRGRLLLESFKNTEEFHGRTLTLSPEPSALLNPQGYAQNLLRPPDHSPGPLKQLQVALRGTSSASAAVGANSSTPEAMGSAPLAHAQSCKATVSVLVGSRVEGLGFRDGKVAKHLWRYLLLRSFFLGFQDHTQKGAPETPILHLQPSSLSAPLFVEPSCMSSILRELKLTYGVMYGSFYPN